MDDWRISDPGRRAIRSLQPYVGRVRSQLEVQHLRHTTRRGCGGKFNTCDDEYTATAATIVRAPATMIRIVYFYASRVLVEQNITLLAQLALQRMMQ